jgi:uncharacterized protein (UPF0332 family)
VTPEAADYLEKARHDLDEARKIAAIGLAKAAARSVYYAAFHAAEAFIVERTGKVAKSHSGVRSEFARLAKEAPQFDKAFTAFLSKAYKYKEIGDYGVGRSAIVNLDEANDVIERASIFLDAVTNALAARSSPSDSRPT